MKPVGIFYGSTSGTTRKMAEKIKNALGKDAHLHNIHESDVKTITQYENLVFGTSAWGIGDMQDDWEHFIDDLNEIDFKGKKVALFGLGDQEEYPESFVDGLGTMYCRLPDKSVVVGEWPKEGYNFYFSLAEKDGKFVGLVLDEHHQADLSDKRIQKWVTDLKKAFI
ncbi:MAG: flavodoxin [Bacteroidales bacterium]|jgi:flavodoxin I|nr:flavodoxin [Bacteroidales bacterium]